MTGKNKGGITLADICSPSDQPPNEADELTRKERLDLDLEAKAQEIKSQQLDITQREEYAKLIYKLIMWWLVAILGIVLLQGFGSICGFFSISDKVLITLIGGTTINVLGLFAIVANYIFRKPV